MRIHTRALGINIHGSFGNTKESSFDSELFLNLFHWSKMKSLLISLVFSIATLQIGQAQTALSWPELTNIEEVEGGFVKTSLQNGYEDNSAQSAQIGGSSLYCFTLSPNELEWPDIPKFKLLINADVSIPADEEIYEMEFDGGDLTLTNSGGTITIALSATEEVKVQMNQSLIKLFVDGAEEDAYTVTESVTNYWLLLAIEEGEANVPVETKSCVVDAALMLSGICSSISSKKYTLNKAYSPSATLISENIDIRDNFGRSLQTQYKNIEDDILIGKQLVYDGMGRSALVSFEAPMNSTSFCYDQNFIADQMNFAPYGYRHFDLPNTTANAPGEENSPIGVTDASTLGNYYSDASDNHVSNTSYPYTRVHYTHDLFQGIRKTSGYNNTFVSGGGHETYNFNTVAGTELEFLYSYLGSYTTDKQGDPTGNYNLKLFKQIERDPNGKERISYTNSNSQVVASCSSGGTNYCRDQVSEMIVHQDVLNEFHVPSFSQGSIQIRFPDPGGYYDNYINGSVVYCLSCFEISLYDMISGNYLVENTDYQLVQRAADPRIYDIDLLGNYSTGAQVLGIRSTPTSQAQTTFSDYLQFNNANLNPVLTHTLDYHDWTLLYYDAYGNLTKKVQPEGVNCDYNALNGHASIERFNVGITNTSGGKTVYAVTFDAIATNTNELKLALYPFGVYPYTYPEPSPTDNEQQYIVGREDDGSGGTVIFGAGKKAAISVTEKGVDHFYDALYDTQNAQLFTSSTPAPTVPTNPDMVKGDRMSYKADIEIIALKTNGTETLLESFEFELLEESLTYFTRITNGSNVTIDWNTVKKGSWTRKKNGVVMDENDLQKFDKFTLSDNLPAGQDIKDYYRLEVRVDNVKMYDKLLKGECTSGCPTITWGTTPSYVNVAKFNFAGFVGHKYKSLPAAVTHKNLVESYNYNDLNRLKSKTIPDEGLTEYIYSSDGKLRFWRNEEEAAQGNFRYNIYDAANRIVETGLYNPNGPYSGNPVTHVFTIDEPASPIPSTNVHYIKNDKNGMEDDFRTQPNFFEYDLPASDLPLITGYSSQRNLKGRLSKTSTGVISSWYSYDFSGNLEWEIISIPDVGKQSIRYTYDNLNNLTTISVNDFDVTSDYYIKYQYDANQRLTAVFASLDPSSGYKKLADYQYNELGNLIRKELGAGYQGLDYYYTVQGQLKSINNAFDLSKDGGADGINNSAHEHFFPDKFAETLSYYDSDFAKANSNIQTIKSQSVTNDFTGLIKAATWNSPYAGSLQSLGSRPTFVYTYDDKRQLTLATLGNADAGSMNGSSSGTAPGFTSQPDYGAAYAYDHNGNIETIKRDGYGSINEMDDLTMHYPKDENGYLTSNRLRRVADGVSTTTYNGEMTNQTSTDNYLYTDDGRLHKDLASDIEITYTAWGQVRQVKDISTGYFIEQNTYDAQQQLVRKRTYNSSGTLSKSRYTLYSSGGQMLLEYEKDHIATGNPELVKTFVAGQGRVATGIHDAVNTSLDYHYELKDHIGNVRLAFRSDATINSQSSFASSLGSWTTRSNTAVSYENGGVKLASDLAGGLVRTFSLTQNKRYTFRVYLNEVQAQNIRVSILEGGTNINLLKENNLQQGYNEIAFYNPTTANVHLHLFIPLADAAVGSYFNLKYFDIYEDELEVLKYSDYYPYGWEMPGRQYTSSLSDGDFAYQGDHARKSENLDWHEFQLRNYDSRIGRWLNPDPAYQYNSLYKAMGNNPISTVDPNGAYGYATEGGEREYQWFEGEERMRWQDDNGVWWRFVTTDIIILHMLKGHMIVDEVTIGGKSDQYFNSTSYTWTTDTDEDEAINTRDQWVETHKEKYESDPDADKTYSAHSDLRRKQERDQVILKKLGFFTAPFYAIEDVVKVLPTTATFRLALTSPRAFRMVQRLMAREAAGEIGYTYRALTSADAASLRAGNGLVAKAPNGAWSLEQHLTHGSSSKAWLNNPWIATSAEINIARSFASGNGIARISLSRLPASSIQRGWMSLPRSSAGYHYSIWQNEVSIYQYIPHDAIKLVK